MLIRSAKHFDVFLIKDGIYAAVAKPGSGSVANSGFVDLGESILVFDSFNTQQAAAELRGIIQSITGKSVSHVINSHWHGDHVRGNQEFQDATIVATSETKSIMQERHPSRISEQREGIEGLRRYIQQLEQQRIAADDALTNELDLQISFLRELEVSLPTLELVLPNVTFESAWSISGSSHAVDCLSLGAGHTASDAVLYVPDQKVCYIGDLVAVENHMLVVDSDVQSWITILRNLTTLDIEYVIPGHGPISTRESIITAVGYLEHLLEEAESLRAKRIASEHISEENMPAAYRAWSAKGVYVQNLRHLVSA